jgi:hypothetical protein
MKFPGTDDDLIARLSSPPQMKAEIGSAFNPVFEENIPEPVSPKFDDFEPVPQSEPELEPEPAPRPEPSKPYSYYLNEAKGIVGFLDGISSIFLPVQYKKRLIGEENLKKSQELSDSVKQGKNLNDFTEAERDLLNRYLKVDELIKSIPFQEDEKQMLIPPMAELMEKYSTAVGPEWRLMFAVGAVSFPRLLPLWKGV